MNKQEFIEEVREHCGQSLEKENELLKTHNK